jgi:hypothetical protein
MYDFNEDDELFGGTPQKKYFDIIFNANRNLVEHALTENLKRMSILESLLEERLEEGADIDQMILTYAMNNQTKVEDDLNNAYIHGMGDILTKNE